MGKSKKIRKSRAATTTAEEFVLAWKKGGTVSDVAARLGVAVASVTSRGLRLRKVGVKLPQLNRRAGHRIDVAALNSLLK